MKLQTFDGGLNSRVAEHLLGINEGVTFTNIETEQGVLEPVNALAKTTLTLTENARYIDFADAIQTLAKTPHTLVEYQNKVYYSVLGDFIQMKDSTTEGDLGLDPPTILGTTVGVTLPTTPVIGDLTFSWVDSTTDGAFVDGATVQFAITQVDADNRESIPFLWSPVVTTAGGAFAELDLELPYKFKIYQKIAGIWKIWFTIGSVPLAATTTIRFTYASAIFGPFFNAGWLNEVDVDAMIAQTAFVNRYSYVATTFSSALGWESEPSAPTEVAPDAGGTDVVTLTINVDVPDARVDLVKVYRLGGTITDYTFIGQYDASTSPITVSDNAPDTNISGNAIMAAEDHDKPLQSITNLAIVNGQLIGTLGSKLYFSVIGKPYAMPPTNFRDFEETLTGCFSIDAGLLVFSARKTWLINTSNIATGRIIRLSANFGCLGQETVVGYTTGAMWTSIDGICTSHGGKVQLVTKEKLGYVNLEVSRAQMHNETYFGFTDLGLCVALDMRYTPSIKTFIFALFDDLLGATEVRQVYIDDSELKVLFGAVAAVDSYEVFGGTTKETMVWLSPKFLEGSFTELKTYKDLYVRATDKITFKVFIDDEEISSTYFREEDTHHIKVPQPTHKGYSVQFQVSGTGTVYEIEYKAMGRKDGR